MAPTKAEIESLIECGPKKASIPQLEAFLEAQMSGNEAYHSKAVRTLVKLYQLFSVANTEKIAQACFLSLLEFPETDLLALSYIIPTSTQKTEPVATILLCYNQLEACQFVEFWKTYASLQTKGSVADLAKKSVPRLQKSILSVLRLTYKTAPVDVVTKALNVSSLADVEGVSVKGDTVTIGGALSEKPREQVYQEGNVTYSKIHALLGKTRA